MFKCKSIHRELSSELEAVYRRLGGTLCLHFTLQVQIQQADSENQNVIPLYPIILRHI
jgi:hypothetical protein